MLTAVNNYFLNIAGNFSSVATLR